MLSDGEELRSERVIRGVLGAVSLALNCSVALSAALSSSLDSATRPVLACY